jgi:hypothetical protein
MKQVLAFPFLLLLASCGGGGSAPDAARTIDAPHVDGGSATIDSDLTPCNELSLTGVTPVEIEQVATAAPVTTGGTPVPGTYVVTSATIYTGTGGATGSAGASEAAIIKVDATTFQLAAAIGSEMLDQSATYVVSGTGSAATLTTTDMCPDTKVAMFHYSATQTTLTLDLAVGNSVQELAFAIQP